MRSCCNNESTTTRIETHATTAPHVCTLVAIMNPLQQGLKLIASALFMAPSICCNNESTTTRIETYPASIRQRNNRVAIMNPLQQGLKPMTTDTWAQDGRLQ